MANIREMLEEAERLYGDRIEAVVVGCLDAYPYDHKPDAQTNVVLSREDGLRALDREYDNGFGGADCHPMYAWTASRVFLMHEYDGATGLQSVPRNPIAETPAFGGDDGWALETKAARAEQASAIEAGTGKTA